MNLNELRTEALRRASEDCRCSAGIANMQAPTVAVLARAKAYLRFLLGTTERPAQKKSTRRRR